MIDETQKAALQARWEQCLRLRAMGNRLLDASNGLLVEIDRLKDESRKLWDEEVEKAYGSVEFKWEWVKEKQEYRCIMETGDTFEP